MFIGPVLKPIHLEILTEPALKFVAALHRTFDTTRKQVRPRLNELNHTIWIT